MRDFKHIKTAVIGAGSMGKNHVRILSELSSLIAVCDIDEVNGKKVADDWGVKWVKDYKTILGEVDAVSIAVPTEYHLPVSLNVSKSGVHMLVEKPLADSFNNAEKIVRAAKNHQVILGVGHIERYNPVVSFAKEKLDSKEWGKLVTMSSKRLSNYPHRIRDVGVVFDIAIHDIDVFNYLSGNKVQKVHANGGSFTGNGVEDNVCIIMKYNNNVNGIIEANWLTPGKFRKLYLTCTNAYVELDYMEQKATVTKLKNRNIDSYNLWEAEYDFEVTQPKIIKKEPLRNEILDFLNSVSSKSSTLVKNSEACYNISLAEKITKSLKK